MRYASINFGVITVCYSQLSSGFRRGWYLLDPDQRNLEHGLLPFLKISNI